MSSNSDLRLPGRAVPFRRVVIIVAATAAICAVVGTILLRTVRGSGQTAVAVAAAATWPSMVMDIHDFHDSMAPGAAPSQATTRVDLRFSYQDAEHWLLETVQSDDRLHVGDYTMRMGNEVTYYQADVATTKTVTLDPQSADQFAPGRYLYPPEFAKDPANSGNSYYSASTRLNDKEVVAGAKDVLIHDDSLSCDENSRRANYPTLCPAGAQSMKEEVRVARDQDGIPVYVSDGAPGMSPVFERTATVSKRPVVVQPPPAHKATATTR